MKHTSKKYKFIIEKVESGFSVYSDKYPMFSTGRTISELYNNCIDALNLFLEDKNEYATKSNIKFEIDLKQFFNYYRVINAKYLAQRIGMNETLLSQYVKGHKKPSAKQVNKILEGVNEIGLELAQINFATD